MEITTKQAVLKALRQLKRSIGERKHRWSIYGKGIDGKSWVQAIEAVEQVITNKIKQVSKNK